MNILLLEDEPAHAEAVRRALEASGLKAVVQVAGTLREYHEAVAARPPDIALLDMILPDGRALDVLTSLPDACPFPILIMTSYGNEQTAVMAMKAGALDYIVKSPESFDTMPHAVERALREWNVLQERKRAEEGLHKMEENYHRSLDGSPLGMRIVTAEGDTLYANKAILDLYGFDSLEELNKTLLKDRYAPQNYAEHKNRKIQRQKADFPSESEISIVRKNGEVCILQVFRKEVLWNGGKQHQALYLDITARKMAEERLIETLRLLRQAITSTIQVVGLMVEARDPYTAGHQQRTTILAEAIAREMGWPLEKIEGLHMAGLVHDVGKISIPAEILSKPTKLTPGEYELVKTHAERGYEILKDVDFPWPLAEIVYEHHERMDGSGYPRGLKGDDILMEARILSVSDTMEAMVSHRPYRPGQGVNTALAEVEKNKGILYDAAVAETCLKLFRKKRFRFPARNFS
jgi:PAS domain S-box-containing protein/putative nucleotidyltransferase with HDIG domain